MQEQREDHMIYRDNPFGVKMRRAKKEQRRDEDKSGSENEQEPRCCTPRRRHPDPISMFRGQVFFAGPHTIWRFQEHFDALQSRQKKLKNQLIVLPFLV